MRPGHTNSSETSPPGRATALPDDPGQEALPIAQPEPIPRGGVPVQWKADRQTWAGHTATLYGVEEFHYRDYVLRADKVVYNQETSELEAEGHLQMSGGPDDIVLTASRGDMRLNMHTARFYDVTGTLGRAPRRTRHRVLHAQSISLFGARPAPDRRGHVQDRRRHHDQLPPAQARLAVAVASHRYCQRQSLDDEHDLQTARGPHFRPALPEPPGGRDRPRERPAHSRSSASDLRFEVSPPASKPTSCSTAVWT